MVTKKDEFKNIIHELKINGCSECGKILNSRFMHFHHVMKENYKFKICNARNKTNDELIEELKKCILLCNKCHQKYEQLELNCTDTLTL